MAAVIMFNNTGWGIFHFPFCRPTGKCYMTVLHLPTIWGASNLPTHKTKAVFSREQTVFIKQSRSYDLAIGGVITALTKLFPRNKECIVFYSTGAAIIAVVKHHYFIYFRTSAATIHYPDFQPRIPPCQTVTVFWPEWVSLRYNHKLFIVLPRTLW